MVSPFHQARFPWNKGGFHFFSATFWGEAFIEVAVIGRIILFHCLRSDGWKGLWIAGLNHWTIMNWTTKIHVVFPAQAVGICHGYLYRVQEGHVKRVDKQIALARNVGYRGAIAKRVYKRLGKLCWRFERRPFPRPFPSCDGMCSGSCWNSHHSNKLVSQIPEMIGSMPHLWSS